MIARIHKSMNEKDKGFTLIELLVVVIIIGILSAIAIPVFLNQRKKAVDSGIKSDLRTVATALETYMTDTQKYPTTVTASTATSGKVTIPADATAGTPLTDIKVTTGNIVTVEATADTYCIYGENERGTGGAGKGFTYKSDGGLLTGAAAAEQCP
jgi:prepilin-type N-terminal cleavage/methylation domain-containing protein